MFVNTLFPHSDKPLSEETLAGQKLLLLALQKRVILTETPEAEKGKGKLRALFATRRSLE